MGITLRGLLPTFTPALLVIRLLAFFPDTVKAADRLIGLHSAQVMSQSMPWIAQEAGLFKKYDLEFAWFSFPRRRSPLPRH